MRLITFLVFLLFASSCSTSGKVDQDVDQQITSIFNAQNPKLWTMAKNEFFARIIDLGLLDGRKDSLQAIYDLIEFVQREGFPDKFCANKSDSTTIYLINELKRINFLVGDESAHRFLHPICKSAVDQYGYKDQNDPLFNYGFYDPDSVGISFNITATMLNARRNHLNLKRPGLYKVILLFYLSEMIREKDDRNQISFLSFFKVKTDSTANNAIDSCVFNDDYEGLTREWLASLKIDDFIWSDKRKQALIPKGQDTVLLSKGGCTHFTFYVALKSSNDGHPITDSVFWIQKALTLGAEYQMDYYVRAIQEGKIRLTQHDPSTTWYEIEDDDPDDNLVYTGIEIAQKGQQKVISISQYFN